MKKNRNNPKQHINTEKNTVQQTVEEDLKFIVNNNKLGDSVLPVSWCVSKNTLQMIKDNELLNPHLLIITSRANPDKNSEPGKLLYFYSEESRILVPLKQSLHYLSFSKAGLHRINGVVVGSKDNEYKTIRNHFLAKQNLACVDNITGNLWFEENAGVKIADTFMDVDVSAEFFAPEPSEKEKKWVNMWFDKNPRDQCQYRKRKIFAYSLQIPLFLIFIVLLRFLLVIGGTILGYRGLGYKTLFHPYRDDFIDIFADTDSIIDSIFFTNKDGGFRFWTLPFFPVVPLIVLFIGSITLIPGNDGHTRPYPIFTYDNFLYGLILYGYFIVGYYGIITLLWLFGIAFDWVDKKMTQILKRAPEPITPQIEQQNLDLGFLACDKRQNLIPGMDSVPKQNRTIYLRFLDIKAKVCKPFQT